MIPPLDVIPARTGLLIIDFLAMINILNTVTSNSPKKAIQGTPWYSILSNAEYSDSFAYFGAHIDEREKLIKDGDDDDTTNCE